MMLTRRTVLALFCAVAPLSYQAKADVPVIDVTAIVNSVKQIGWLKNQYEMMTQQLRALSNGINLNSIAPGLLSPGTQNPLGSVMPDLQGLVGGAMMTGNAQNYLQQDQLYQPGGNDFMATQMNGSAVSLANLKDMAMTMVNGNQTRIDQLSLLQDELSTAQDVSQVERINGRIALENQTLAAQAQQVAMMQQMADAQQRVNDQRERQRIRADDDAQIQATQPGAGTNGITTRQGVNSPTFMNIP